MSTSAQELDDIDSLIAAEVRSLMARRRITGVELARAVGMSQPAWSRRQTGEVPFTGGELYDVAAALGVPVAALYPEPPTPATTTSVDGNRGLRLITARVAA